MAIPYSLRFDLHANYLPLAPIFAITLQHPHAKYKFGTPSAQGLIAEALLSLTYSFMSFLHFEITIKYCCGSSRFLGPLFQYTGSRIWQQMKFSYQHLKHL